LELLLVRRLTCHQEAFYDAHGQMRTFKIILAGVILYSFANQVQAEPQLVTGVDAVVHDSIITYQEVEFSTAPVLGELRRRYSTQPDMYRQKLTEVLNDNLQQMINQQLILHEYERAGYKIPDSIIDQAVEERIRTRFPDRATFTKEMQAQGMTFEQFRKQVRNQIIVGAMQHNFVSEASIISPHKIEVYYQAHQADYQLDDQVKLRMIVLNRPISEDNGQTKRMADEVLTKINGGASFAEMATTYSQGSQASQGGDLGWVEKKILRKELSDAAFSLKPGERSGVLELSDGYYILLVEDKQPAHVKPLKDVRAEIEKNIAADDRSRLEKVWVDKLQEKTFVRKF
jgi:parvulin-like peptidyl-prolyl isomerase